MLAYIFKGVVVMLDKSSSYYCFLNLIVLFYLTLDIYLTFSQVMFQLNTR